MDNAKTHIFPDKNFLVSSDDKEGKMNQKGKVIWFTGLSGSGKSTIAKHLEKLLFNNNFTTSILDGDNVRSGLTKGLSFSEEDRIENIRRIAEVSKLFVENGIICLCCFVSPTKDIRSLAKEIVGEENFLEIFVNTPLEICEQRDTKGLYKKARAGEVKNFTGIDAPFEAPEAPAYSIETQGNPEDAAEEVLAGILKFIRS